MGNHKTSVHRSSFANIKSIPKQKKLTSMEGIVKLLNSSNAAFVDSATFGYAVRRFVVPAVLKNAQTHDMDVFRCNLNIVSTLWKKWRAHLKIEFAIIIVGFRNMNFQILDFGL